uniref:G-protein coupled receptors family 3 profile domain-containing protein n=1 Tax=Electrophorus electricus TaxID=8005 RepID=A0A4W4FKI7_ELEEL
MPMGELVVLALFLFIWPRVRSSESGSGCQRLGEFAPQVLELDGDVILGGLFPLHYIALEPDHAFTDHVLHRRCSGFDLRAFRWFMTMVFAIEEINRNPSLLPGVKLGYRILDSCDHVHTSLQSMFSLINGSSSTQREGSASSNPHCLSRAPISYFATCTCLTDKRVYPSFLRTVPSDVFQVRALVQLMVHFDWRWVGTMGTEDDYSRYGIQAFTEQLKEWGGCVAFHCTIPKVPTLAQISAIADALEASTARVVVVFATEGQLMGLLSEVARRNLTGWQWVASEAWVTARVLTAPEFQHVLAGTLGFSFRGANISGLAEFLLRVRPSPNSGSVFSNLFWEEQFNCRLPYGDGERLERPLCTGLEDLEQVESSYTSVYPVRVSYNVYKGVYAIGHALHLLLQCTPMGQQSDQRGCNNDSQFTSEQVIEHFLLFSGSLSTECIKCPLYYWSNNERVACVAGIEEFLSFQEIMGIILVTLSLLGVAAASAVSIIFFLFRATPIVKANNSELSFLLLLSLKLCFLCSLVFVGRPSLWACQVRQVAFGISFVLCISCILVKTIVVLLAFHANIPGATSLKRFGPPQQRAFIVACTAGQAVLCIAWLALAPPYLYKNTSYQDGRIVLECKDVWPLGFYMVLGYIGLLSSVCFVLAFLGRKLPDTFNEAKLITFSMLIFFAVWISFIPAYNSSPGKYTVAVEIFAILASAFGLLLCIFIPKCYIILLRPELNTKKGMTGKASK